MEDISLFGEVQRLGECRIPSPMTNIQYVDDSEKVLYHNNLTEIERFLNAGEMPPQFEMGGPRENIYFDPANLKCGIVTCGGLCPGLNDVIRAIVLSLFHHYGAKTVFGFRYGYEGLSYRHGHKAMELTPESVEDIHKKGGTILSSSRGPQDSSEMVDTLERMNIGILFTLGGDGTLRGAQAISEEIERRKLKISVIGIPKTIDNDISFVEQSFGFETAVFESKKAISSAHIEAVGAKNGVGLVKLMGRHSGFIAAFATLANSEVNFCLVPEIKFSFEGFINALKERLEHRGHAVVVVGEGAGQKLMEATHDKDASGNIKLGDIGTFLKGHIGNYFKDAGIELNIKYIDPSYIIRSVPANPHDSALCLLMGYNAVHAGMAGRTNMVVGSWRREPTHLPISLAVSECKQINPKDKLWNNVLSATGQPRNMI
ncbi:MAG: ATP-dependent 6-phosphofructokinase [Deltaproteobacteria bacterium]|nr:ATP-dependent 6-phosphofructokinase [Deltaproteobacteria bacterium]